MSDLQIVVALQQGLDELAQNEEQLGGIPDWMQELHGRYSERKAEIDALETASNEAAAERRASAAEASDLQVQLKTYQEQIGRVRNQREYGALLHEIDTVKERIREAEESGFGALERQDEAQKQLEEQKQSFDELDQQYKTELAKWEEQKPDLAKRVEELRQEVQGLEEKLPANILAFYQRILEKHRGHALADVRKTQRVGKGPQIWHCGACNYRVRPQAVVEITNNGNLVTCDSCKRILYIAE